MSCAPVCTYSVRILPLTTPLSHLMYIVCALQERWDSRMWASGTMSVNQSIIGWESCSMWHLVGILWYKLCVLSSGTSWCRDVYVIHWELIILCACLCIPRAVWATGGYPCCWLVEHGGYSVWTTHWEGEVGCMYFVECGCMYIL